MVNRLGGLSLPRKSRFENPQKPTQLSPKSHPRHLVGKKTAQRDINKDITSDSQVDSYFPYRWSPSSLTFNIHFYIFLNVCITRITINNDSAKNQNRRAALGRPENLLESFNLFAVDQPPLLVLSCLGLMTVPI